MRSLGFTLFLSATVHAVAAAALLVGFPSSGSSDRPNVIVTDLIFEVDGAPSEPMPSTEVATTAPAANHHPDLAHQFGASRSDIPDAINDPIDPTAPAPASRTSAKDETAPPFHEESDGVDASGEKDREPPDLQVAERYPSGKAVVAAPISKPNAMSNWNGRAPRNKPMPAPSRAKSVAAPPRGGAAVATAQAPTTTPTGNDTPSTARGSPTAKPPTEQYAPTLAALPPSGTRGIALVDDANTLPAQYAGMALGNRAPKYPYAARRTGAEGRVVIEVSVGRNGVVLNASVVESSGHRLLDRSALEAVRGWTFIPAKRRGHSVASTIAVPFVFLLAGETASVRE